VNTLTIRRPDDFHVHLREGRMTELVLPFTAQRFARGLVMPNLQTPIITPVQIIAYRDHLLRVAAASKSFTPLMTFYLHESILPADIKMLKAAGAIAGKLYPKGVTTGSEHGATDVRQFYPHFKEMEEHGLVLCLHGEVPGAECLDRERVFLRTLVDIAHSFRRLRIVLEHVTTAEAVHLICALPPNVAATITVHHLYLTIDDVIGDKCAPHNFCKPIAKRRHDREALVGAATSGNPKFFLGTDSAPHDRSTKECAAGCAGVFTAPCAMAALIAKFEENNALDRVDNFTSVFGARFYSLPLNEGTCTYKRGPWTIPHFIELGSKPAVSVVPFMAGKELAWWQA
jgi:dihydroorotase